MHDSEFNDVTFFYMFLLDLVCESKQVHRCYVLTISIKWLL